MILISDTRDKLITVICDMNPHVIPPSLRLHHDEIDSILTDMVNEIERIVHRTAMSSEALKEAFKQIRGEVDPIERKDEKND